jgi:hypothetical protein
LRIKSFSAIEEAQTAREHIAGEQLLSKRFIGQLDDSRNEFRLFAVKIVSNIVSKYKSLKLSRHLAY